MVGVVRFELTQDDGSEPPALPLSYTPLFCLFYNILHSSAYVKRVLTFFSLKNF